MPEASAPRPTDKRGRHPFDDADFARNAAAIGVAVRRLKAKQVAELIETALAAADDVDFALLSLASVREQIIRLDAISKQTTKANDLRDLALARRSLQDQERVLAGRPMPSAKLAELQRRTAPARGPAEPLA
jgi:hypothetical protein